MITKSKERQDRNEFEFDLLTTRAIVLKANENLTSQQHVYCICIVKQKDFLKLPSCSVFFIFQVKN